MCVCVCVCCVCISFHDTLYTLLQLLLQPYFDFQHPVINTYLLDLLYFIITCYYYLLRTLLLLLVIIT